MMDWGSLLDLSYLYRPYTTSAMGDTVSEAQYSSICWCFTPFHLNRWPSTYPYIVTVLGTRFNPKFANLEVEKDLESGYFRPLKYVGANFNLSWRATTCPCASEWEHQNIGNIYLQNFGAWEFSGSSSRSQILNVENPAADYDILHTSWIQVQL